MTRLILILAISALTGCNAFVLPPPKVPSEYREPCKPPVHPVDGKHATVEQAFIKNAAELRRCGAKLDYLNGAIDRRDALAK